MLDAILHGPDRDGEDPPDALRPSGLFLLMTGGCGIALVLAGIGPWWLGWLPPVAAGVGSLLVGVHDLRYPWVSVRDYRIERSAGVRHRSPLTNKHEVGAQFQGAVLSVAGVVAVLSGIALLVDTVLAAVP